MSANKWLDRLKKLETPRGGTDKTAKSPFVSFGSPDAEQTSRVEAELVDRTERRLKQSPRWRRSLIADPQIDGSYSVAISIRADDGFVVSVLVRNVRCTWGQILELAGAALDEPDRDAKSLTEGEVLRVAQCVGNGGRVKLFV